MTLTPMMPSACCWRTASLSHLRAWSTMSLGSAPGAVWKRTPLPPGSFVVPFESFRGDGVRKDKKSRAVAALRREALDEQPVFVVEHLREPLVRDVARRLAVDGVAERH